MQDQGNPYAAPAARIEQINDNLDQGKASRGARLGAYLIDAVLYGIVLAPYYYETIQRVAAVSAGTATPATATMGLGTLSIVGIGAMVVLGIINLVMLWKTGQTIGKKIVGMRIVRTDGNRASFPRLFFLRYLVPGIVTAIPIVGLVFWFIDVLWIFGEQRRCVHDLIADTIVVEA
jgi:uncharacterized RDD family membrane protein YckC